MANSVRDEVKNRDGMTCQKCGRQRSKERLHAHHIHPKWAGGPDTAGNLITLCASCHHFAPEHADEEKAVRMTALYISTDVPPYVDLFLFGIEFAVLNDGLDIEFVDNGAQPFAEAISHLRTNDLYLDPTEHSDWFSLLRGLLITQRQEHDKERLELPDMGPRTPYQEAHGDPEQKLATLNLGLMDSDQSSMGDEILLNLLAWAAELEGQNVAEATAEGIKAAKEEGKWVGHPPYGFTTDDDGFLEPNDNFQNAIEAIHAVENLGWSDRKTAKHSGVPRRTVPNVVERKDLYLNEHDGQIADD